MVTFMPYLNIKRQRYVPQELARVPHSEYALAAKTGIRSRKMNTLVVECDPVLERLYRAIQKVSGAAVIVDSSKRSTYAVLLSLLPFADLRVVHLVRDSRAVAYSWGRIKESPAVVGGRLMPRTSPAKDRKSTRLNSSHANISYAVFCLKKKRRLSMLVERN